MYYIRKEDETRIPMFRPCCRATITWVLAPGAKPDMSTFLCCGFNPSEQSLKDNIPRVCLHCANMLIATGLPVILCSHSISAGWRRGRVPLLLLRFNSPAMKNTNTQLSLFVVLIDDYLGFTCSPLTPLSPGGPSAPWKVKKFFLILDLNMWSWLIKVCKVVPYFLLIQELHILLCRPTRHAPLHWSQAIWGNCVFIVF